MEKRARLWLAWTAVFCLAFALRAIAAWQYSQAHPLAQELVIDEAAYDRWAQRIAGGQWSEPTAFFQEPLYAYGLGLLYRIFGRDFELVRGLQVLLAALTSLGIGALAARSFGMRAGLWTALACACYRPLLLFPALLLKPIVFLALLTALAHVLISAQQSRRDWPWSVVGVLTGLGGLVRGNLFVLGPVLCAWPLAQAWRENTSMAVALRRSSLALAGWLISLAPAALHNARVANLWWPTSGAGTNFAIGNDLSNPWGRPGELDFVRGIPEYEADDWRREAERRTGRAMGPNEVSQYWLRESLRSIARRPLEHLSLWVRKLRLSLGTYEVPDNHHLDWDAQYVPVLRWPWPAFGVWGALGLAGLGLCVWRRWRLTGGAPLAAASLALLFVLYLFTIVVTMTSMRIRLGLLPMLLPFAGCWLEEATRALRQRREGARELLHVAATLVLALCMVHWPTLDAKTRHEDWLGRDYNLAVSLEQAGQWRAARSIALRLDQELPGTTRVRILAALCDFDAAQEAARANREAEAHELLLSALDWLGPLLEPPVAIARERHRAEALAGRIAFSLGEWAKADQHLQRALEFAPDERELALLRMRSARRALAGSAAAQRLPALLALHAELESWEADFAQSLSRGLSAVESAEIDFERARALLELGSENAAAAESLRVEALRKLRTLVETAGLATEVQIEARLSAATMQLYLGRSAAARNHLEAALSLDPNQARAKTLLQQLDSLER